MTPPDYQPPGFQHTDACEFLFKQEPLNIKVGDVSTVIYDVRRIALYGVFYSSHFICELVRLCLEHDLHSDGSVQLRIKTDASQFELKENEGEGLGAADDTISSQAMDVSQVLKEDKEDNVISSDAAVEPIEGRCGSDQLPLVVLYISCQFSGTTSMLSLWL